VAQHYVQFADVQDSRIIDLEYRMMHSNGTIRWLWARDTVFQRRPNGAVWQIMGTAQDITDRKNRRERFGRVKNAFASSPAQPTMRSGIGTLSAIPSFSTNRSLGNLFWISRGASLNPP
jgi:hypothetical protein